MFFVGDVLLVEMVDEHGFGVVGSSQQLDEVVLEVPAVVGDDSLRAFGADGLDLADVAFGLDVAFEAVFVPVLFFADLTVPA